ncbi:MAG: hypothetical protein ACI9D5_001321 [Candidatus Endobugula sp.]|jgi:hypothetical protein
MTLGDGLTERPHNEFLRGLLKQDLIKVILKLLKCPVKQWIFFSKAKTGDLLVIQSDEPEPIMRQIQERYQQRLICSKV